MSLARYLGAILLLAVVAPAFAQSSPPNAATPLSELLKEASRHNSQIKAANYAWQAAEQVPRQVSALPAPTFTYQQFSVGSPKPFAGYTNSSFSYVGIGVSQELPYPGKLHLRGEVAERAAGVKGMELDATRASVADDVKSDYLQLAYLQRALGILQRNERVVGQLVEDATAHYEVGQGLQADILKAQVERTTILREITIRREQMGRLQADLKGLVHRGQASPDIVAEPLAESPLRFTAAELLRMARSHNPQIQIDASSIRRQDAALASAKRDGKPDFSLAYMYQNTDRKYRDYYMFSLNIHLPRRSRVKAKVAEAAQKLAESRATLDANLQRQLAQVKQDYVTASSDDELLKEYRSGLIPQSETAYRSTLNAYAANRDQFTHVLLAFVNVLNLRLEEAQVLSEHEIALAHLETLTGAALR